MLRIEIAVILCVIFTLCESLAVVDKQQKCGLTDGDCQLKMLANILDDVAKTGIPEIDIPHIDPYVAKNIDVSLLGMLNLTLVDGTAVGLQQCVGKNMKVNPQTQHATLDFMCDAFIIEGHYTLSTLPAFVNLLSGIDVHGNGKGKLDLEKVHISFDFSFEILKYDDGELHFRIKPEDTTQKFEVMGLKLSGNNLKIGSVDISSVVTAIVNENWKLVAQTLGNSVMERIMEIFYRYINQLFQNVPAKDIITDDLSQYVKN